VTTSSDTAWADGGVLPAAAAPYAPSAINRLYSAIDRLPGGGWWIYPLAYLVLLAYHEAALWLTGSVPFGTLSLAGATGPIYGPYGLAILHIVFRAAGSAMDTFRPASGLSDAAFARRRYELVTLPAGRFGIILVIGAIVTAGSILSAPPESLAAYGRTREVAFFVLGPAAFLGYGITAVSTYASVRILALIHRLHVDATAVDPFDSAPIYAFSRVTSVVGLGYIFAAYYTYLFNFDFQTGNAFGIATLAGIVVLGAACFIVPLWGIHGRLAAEKVALVRAVTVRARALQEELYRRVDDSNLAGIKDVTDALNGVNATREQITRLPTWPWPPQVFRGFISAILLPVVVFLITRVVGTQIR
jgi:hypothetical protein